MIVGAYGTTMTKKIIGVPLALVAWMYAPLFVAAANGGTASVEASIMAWILPAMCALAYGEIKFIASTA